MTGMSRVSGKLLSEEEHIIQCLWNIIFTPLGSRLMRRGFGSKVPFLLGSPTSNKIEYTTAIAEAIKRHEPRFNLLSASVVVKEYSKILIEISGVIKSTGTIISTERASDDK